MEKADSFEVLASGISDSERQDILSRMQDVSQETSPLQPADEKFDESTEPFEVKIKNESLFLRFYIWLKALISNTTQPVIYNEHKLTEISRSVNRNFPGIINAKQGLLLSPFYERLSELKSCADFFKPYFISDEDNEGSFYVFLSSIIMPQVTEEIKHNADPYANPITPEIQPDTRSHLIRKLEEIFDTIPADDKNRMYEAAKASEWLRSFIRLPFAHFITQFSSSETTYTCPFSQVESEIDTFSRVLCSTLAIPDEFLEALYLFAVRNAKRITEETGRDAGEFLNKAHSSLSLLRMFMSSIPIRSIGCLVHADSSWRTTRFSGGEDWFVKYKNACKKMFDQKWLAWEADCKRSALLSTLKVNFNLERFPQFPERPWEELWGGIDFAYDSTLSFLHWFIKERFSECELDLKTLLVQGVFNKKENHTLLSESFNSMVQLSISLQVLARKLSLTGETGAIFNKIREEKSRTLQAQNKVEQMMKSIESEVSTLIHQFGDAARSIIQVLNGILGLTKDTRFDTISNLSKLKDQNNEPFIHKIETAKNTIETALNFVMELENLDKHKK